MQAGDYEKQYATQRPRDVTRITVHYALDFTGFIREPTAAADAILAEGSPSVVTFYEAVIPKSPRFHQRGEGSQMDLTQREILVPSEKRLHSGCHYLWAEKFKWRHHGQHSDSRPRPSPLSPQAFAAIPCMALGQVRVP
jgi:hypothetical protein